MLQVDDNITTVENIKPGFFNQKRNLLVLLLLTFFIEGVVLFFVENDARFGTVNYFGHLAVSLTLVVRWCYLDSLQNNYKISKKMTLLIVCLNLVGMPIYFIKSRGLKKGIKSIFLYVLFLILNMIICGIGYAFSLNIENLINS